MTPQIIESNWNENNRRDGLKVEQRGDRWIVRPRTGGAIALCRCCDLPMHSERAAKLVAETVYPLPAVS